MQNVIGIWELLIGLAVRESLFSDLNGLKDTEISNLAENIVVLYTPSHFLLIRFDTANEVDFWTFKLNHQITDILLKFIQQGFPKIICILNFEQFIHNVLNLAYNFVLVFGFKTHSTVHDITLTVFDHELVSSMFIELN